MAETPEARIVRLETRYEAISKDLKELSGDLKDLKETVHEIRDEMLTAKGGLKTSWKLLVAIGSIGATIGGLLVKYVPFH